MSEPAISIVMPTYNRATSIEASIGSILDQDFADFELLVVDDCSTDSTVDLVVSIADPRIVCLRQPANRGPGAARNHGIREARAPLICFIDSDDRFLPHKLRFVTRFFEENPDIEVLIDSFEVVSTRSANRPRRFLRSNPDLCDSHAIERAIFERRLYKATPAVSARRQALINSGLFDEGMRLREDMDLVLRLTRTARCATTSEVLWTKFWTRGSLSAQLDAVVPAMIEICRRHPQYLAQPELRSGLARDEARHLLRRIVRGQLVRAARELRQLRTFQGASNTNALLYEGLGEIARRARQKRERRKRTKPPPS